MKKIQMNKLNNRSTLKIVPHLLVIWMVSLLSISGFSQQIGHDVICSGGETFISSDFSLEFTMGEIAVESLTGSEYMVTQGFQQGTLKGIGINDQIIDPQRILVYPNPAIDHLYMNSHTEEVPIEIELRNINGQLILTTQYLSEPTSLDLTQLNSGFYTITFRFENYQPVIKKIIKK